MAAAGMPQVDSPRRRRPRARGERRCGGAGRAARARPAGVRQAGAPGLVGRASQGRGRGRARASARGGASPTTRSRSSRPPRPGIEVECSVLGDRAAARVGPRRDRRRKPSSTTTRPSTSRAGWSWSCRPGSASAAAEVARIALDGVRARRLQRPRARRLLRRGRARARSTSSTRCPASPRRACTRSCGRPRHRLPGAGRGALRDRARAPRARAQLPALSPCAQSALARACRLADRGAIRRRSDRARGS